MAFEDSLIGNNDFDPDSAVEDLIRRQAGEPLPDTLSPRMLNTRLARKLNRPDLISQPKAPKQSELDFTSQSASPEEANALDFTSQSYDPELDPATAPIGGAQAAGRPPSPTPTLDAIQGVTSLPQRAIVHGAIQGVGGVLKGAGTALSRPTPAPPDISKQGLDANAAAGFDPANQWALPGQTPDPNQSVPGSNPQDSTLYKIGQGVEGAAQGVAPMTPEEHASLTGRVFEGAGSIAPYAIASALNPVVGLAAGAAGMGLDTYGKTYEDAKSKGATDEEAHKAADMSSAISGLLGALPLPAARLVKGLLAKAAVSGIAFAGSGELQEWLLQEVAKTYDPKAGYSPDAKRVIAELILGAGVGGLHHAFEDHGQPPPQNGKQSNGASNGPGIGTGNSQQSNGPGPGTGTGNGAGPGSGPQGGPNASGGTPPPGGGGPRPGAGPSGNAGSTQGGPRPGSGPGPQPGAKPSGPPPGSGEGMKAGYTMDPQTRAKMERVYRTFEPGKDPSTLADHELYNAVNEHLRDTSATGHTAQGDTAEEKAQRDAHAQKRDEDAELKGKFAWMTDAQIQSMTPEMRQVWLKRARGEQPQEAPKEPPPAAEKKPAQNSVGGEAENVPAAAESAPVNRPTRDNPIVPTTAADVEAAQPVAPKSQAQAEAENYPHAHMELPHLGLEGEHGISVETGVGQTRYGPEGPDGEPEWEQKMTHGAYGRIKGTKGADGQPLDIFVGPHPTSPYVFVVDQHDPNTGAFDEHKIMAGYRTPIDALHAYAHSYNDGGEGRIGHVTAMGPEEFQKWAFSGDTTKALKPEGAPPAAATPVSEGGAAGARSPLTEASPVRGPASVSIHAPERGATSEVPKAAEAEEAKEATTPEPKSLTPQTVKSSRPKEGNSGLSLLQFIASKGGLRPHPELEALGFTPGKHRVQIPGRKGFFGVVRAEGGMEHDKMREAAEEAGYLRGEHNKTSTVDDLYNGMAEEDRGNLKHAEGEEGAKSKAQQKLEAEREQHAREQDEADYGEARRAIAVDYRDLPTDLHELAARIMVHEGLDPDTAVGVAAERLVAQDEHYEETPNSIDDTFGPGAHDEAHGGPVYGDGETPARAGEEASRPGEGEEAGGHGERVPATGAPRGEAEGPRSEVTTEIPATEDDIRPVPLHLGTVYRGTEGGITGQQAIRKSAIGDLGPGVYVTKSEDLAKTYGGGPKASVKAGTRKVHQMDLAPLQPEEVAYVFGGKNENEKVTIVRGDDALLWRGPWSSKNMGELFARTPGIKAVVGTPDSIGVNQIAVRDPSLLTPKEPTTEKGADGKQQLVLPGAEKISQGEQAQRKANERLKPKVGQKSADFGLFGDEMDQGDLLDLTRKNTDKVEKALGADAAKVAPVDIARAAELMTENPEMPVATAFGHAVIETSVDQDFITKPEAVKSYGEEVNQVLDPGREGAPGGGAAPGAQGAQPGEVGTRGAAENSQLPSGGETGEAGGGGRAGENGGATAAAGPEAPEQPAASGGQAAGNPEQADHAAQHQPAAGPADQPVAERIKGAYDAAKAANGGFDMVAIGDLVRDTGLPVEQVHSWLMDQVRASNAMVYPSTLATPSIPQYQQDAAIHLPGHEPLLNTTIKPTAFAPERDVLDDILDSAIKSRFGAKAEVPLADMAKGLGALFGKKKPGKGFEQAENPFFDEAKYKQALPYFRSAVAHFGGNGADMATMARALVNHLADAGMDADAITAMKPYLKRFIGDVTAGRESTNAPSSSDVLEPNRGNAAPENRVGAADVSAAASPAGPGAGAGGAEDREGNARPGAGERVSQDHAPVVGASGNLELPAREPDVEERDAAAGEPKRSGPGGQEGFSFDDAADADAAKDAQKDSDLDARRARQQQANRKNIPFKWGRIDNITESLPMLFPEQHQDVQTAEIRYNKAAGHGMLFTNGTGTGKTYSGLGIIKRFEQQGKRNTLVIAPSQGILTDWQKSARDLGLELHILPDTVSNGKGKGFTGTTYANLGANRTLVDRDWDLVVADESHKLSSDQNGTKTAALSTLRALTLHPDGLRTRAEMVLRADVDRIFQLPEGKRPEAWAAFEKKAAPLIEKWKDEQRPKALMMSATPFAYHFSLDYAEGYLFDYDRSQDGGRYNSGDGRDKFYMQHLGYRMRTNKLTQPEADVKQEVMERQLHEYLKQQGSLSGRMLTVDKDYDRKFTLAHNAIGNQIDQALNFLQENEPFRPLVDIVGKRFDYLTRMRLLEAIKAESAINYINQSLALGRKVVVFHDYNEGGGINPFDLTLDPNTTVSSYENGKYKPVNLKGLYDEFIRQNPYVKDLKFADYPAPITTLTKAFPKALVYNGTVSNKLRNEAKRLFNDDNSGHDIIIVQSAAGEAGISLHDTTGKHQRVILNLGMPVRPTTAIQQEGRIYRVGQASDAIFRYMNTGTDWERWTFAGKIADRAGTAENLALGDQARTIRQSFIDSFANSGDYDPEPGEGTGGKEADRAVSHSVSEFEKAKTHYYANGKTRGKRDQREGTDYYATPEPIGLKMVEFAGIKSGEKILEPSAGHGAIARYFPEDTARTLVEPSSSLASRAALTSPGARVVVDRFENLDKGANKFDAIVMNPPFGSGGKTAIEHVAKAATHLKNGGRIVALIPRGASADKRFDDFMDSQAAKGLYLVGDVGLPSVTFERAGTSIISRIVVLEKQTDPEIAGKLQVKGRDYSDAETIGDLFDRIEHTDLGARLEPKTKDVDAPVAGNITVGGIEFNLPPIGDQGEVYADLKGKKLGREGFARVAQTAKANGGQYLQGLSSFRFPNQEARQAFFDALANPPKEEPTAQGDLTFAKAQTKHAKTGKDLYVATPSKRVDRGVYDAMASHAKANGGWYSSYDKQGAIPGFQFMSEESRQKFLDALNPNKAKSALAEKKEQIQAGAAGQKYVLGQGDGIEHLIAYDHTGKELGRAKGTKSSVDLTPELDQAFRDPNKSIVAHHNHPEGSAPSNADVRMLANHGLHAFWAHGNNGEIYRIALTPEIKAMLPKNIDAGRDTLGRLYQAVENPLYNVIVKAVRASGNVTPDEAARAILHLNNEVLHRAGVLDYRTNYELAPDFFSRVPGLDKAIDDAVAATRRKAFGGNTPPQRDDHSRRTEPLRHAGDLGAAFDRSALGQSAGPLRDPARQAGDRGEAPGGNGAASDLDKTINDILGKRLLGRLGDLNATEMRVQLQDKFRRIAAAEELKGNTDSRLSAYQAESLYYGRTGHQLETLQTHHIDPLIREMKARDIDLESMDKFLYARHAPERNAKLGALYDQTHDFNKAIRDPSIKGASGMSQDEALKIIRDIRQAGKLPDYQAVAAMVDTLNFNTRNRLFNAGLIDRDTLDELNRAYKYYVPLRGFQEGDDESGIPHPAAGMDTRARDYKQAFGRKSLAASPLAYSIMQAEHSIVRAEKNRVGQTFLKFVKANPDPDLWTVNRPDVRKYVSKVSGLVTSTPDYSLNDPHLFVTRVDGKQVQIRLKGGDGANMVRALKNLGTANVHAAIRAMAAVTHTMAKLATAWNPEFMIPNLARDLGEAFINLGEQKQKRFVRSFVGHIPRAIAGASLAIAGHTPKAGSAMEPYVNAFHEFDSAGGRVRFFGIDDPDAIEKNVNAKLKRLGGGVINTMKDLGDRAGRALEIAGGGIENGTRLAAYMAARDAGMSVPDSAMLGRNLTVNFNKKGELGTAIGSLYMFANAGAQGSARTLRALHPRNRKVWAAVGALVAANALAALFNLSTGGQDEAGTPTYMKIPYWERDKNLIVMIGHGHYLKLPMPYGFSPFAVLGQHAVSVLMGKEKPTAAAAALLGSIGDAFNPLGEESSSLLEMIPTAIRPAFHIAFNKSWTGKPIYPEREQDRGKPNSHQSFRSDTPAAKATAEELNKLTGGDAYKPGLIDLHPGSIDHVMGAITGGVGKFASELTNLIITGATDREWNVNQMPVLRRFAGTINEDLADASLYFDARREAKDEANRLAGAKRDIKTQADVDGGQKYLDDNPANGQKAIFSRADHRMKQLRAQADRINNSGQSAAEKAAALDDLRAQMRDVQNHARAESAQLRGQ